MLSVIKYLAISAATLLIIFLAQVAAIYLLPFPFNQINVTLLSLLWLIIYRNNHGFIWLSPIIPIATDLFSSLPFGFAALIMIMTIICTRRIFEIFSNFSWYNIFILALIGIVLYKFFAYTTLWLIHFLFNEIEPAQLPNLISILSEIFINAFIFLIAYLLSRLFARRRIYYQPMM